MLSLVLNKYATFQSLDFNSGSIQKWKCDIYRSDYATTTKKQNKKANKQTDKQTQTKTHRKNMIPVKLIVELCFFQKMYVMKINLVCFFIVYFWRGCGVTHSIQYYLHNFKIKIYTQKINNVCEIQETRCSMCA